MKIQDIIEHTNLTGKNGIALFLDFKKAFILTRLNGHTSRPPFSFFFFTLDLISSNGLAYSSYVSTTATLPRS